MSDAGESARPGHCPVCGARLRALHFAASPSAPLYMRCASCKASLRYASLVQYATAIGWGMVGAVVALTASSFLIGFEDWPRRIASGIVTGIAAAVVVAGFTILRSNLAPRGGPFASDPDTRRYVIGMAGTSFTAVVLLLLAALPIVKVGMENRMLGGLVMPELAGMPRGAPIDARWTLRTLDGETVDFDSLRGRPVFLNIWATWCVPCVAELPDIDELFDEVGDTRAAFVIASNEPLDRVRPFVEEKGYGFPVYVYEGSTPIPFSTPGIPATFILDRTGRLVFSHVGRADWSTPRVRNFLLELCGEN